MAQAQNRNIVEATIDNGTSLSPAVYLAGEVLVGIRMPAAWTAASITFQASMDDVTYLNVYLSTAATELAITVAVDRHIWLVPWDNASYRWLKVRSGAAGAPVNQLAERTIELITRGKA